MDEHIRLIKKLNKEVALLKGEAEEKIIIGVSRRGLEEEGEGGTDPDEECT